jgi:3-methyladenine DNA glycosylase Mpg
VVETSVVSSVITLKQLAELHSETITCCNCIETQAMRGQGYDGAANMADKFSGVRTRIQTEIPEVYYVHCYAHCLNLAVYETSFTVSIVLRTIGS